MTCALPLYERHFSSLLPLPAALPLWDVQAVRAPARVPEHRAQRVGKLLAHVVLCPADELLVNVYL